ncbi:hypothetical protein ADICYQ_5756 [Cyclobacterium qasimii M12-11B]|uniref:Uncharacterized protein n=1 Tax=Cyclobacterium qasimii M12-11B TaxID=641524 RepID=S7WM18_9BACT|nr:hypothetical protein ADICYQ_5756 [Cyclobacterium qasimii M12-11B]
MLKALMKKQKNTSPTAYLNLLQGAKVNNSSQLIRESWD